MVHTFSSRCSIPSRSSRPRCDQSMAPPSLSVLSCYTLKSQNCPNIRAIRATRYIVYHHTATITVTHSLTLHHQRPRIVIRRYSLVQASIAVSSALSLLKILVSKALRTVGFRSCTVTARQSLQRFIVTHLEIDEYRCYCLKLQPFRLVKRRLVLRAWIGRWERPRELSCRHQIRDSLLQIHDFLVIVDCPVIESATGKLDGKDGRDRELF